jgi:hypothetical protein
MSVSTSTSSVNYTGNASTSAPYVVNFQFFDETDLVVVVVNSSNVSTTLVNGTGYTVTGGGGLTGSIVTTSPVPATSRVVITRNTAKTQLTSYVTGDRFPASSHEKALDKLTMLAQEATVNNLPASSTATGTAPYVLQAASIIANPAWVAASQTSAGSAAKLTTARAFSAIGDVTTVSAINFDGTAAVALNLAVGNGVIDNFNIAAAAGIADTKLATIATAGKVSGNAITSGTIGGSTAINTTGTITAASLSGPLSGNATTATTATTANAIADGAVSTTAKIANGIVTAAKLGNNEQKRIAKAWGRFLGTGSGGPAPIANSNYGISSVTSSETGVYQINLISGATSGNLACSAIANWNSAAGASRVSAYLQQASGTFVILRFSTTGGTAVLVDPDEFNVIFFGN